MKRKTVPGSPSLGGVGIKMFKLLKYTCSFLPLIKKSRLTCD